MSQHKDPSKASEIPANEVHDDHEDHHHEPSDGLGVSRRALLGSTALGVAAGALGAASLTGALAAPPPHAQGNPPPHAQGPGKGQRILLKGGVVLTMNPDVPDMEEGDVLIEGSKIVAIGHDLGGGHRIDCKGMIIMPGFIDTHHHQYETIQRAVIPDGNLFAGMPQEAYTTVVQNVWTTGRIGSANNPDWDLGRSPYDPEDCYISELVASWAAINNGVTTGIDTSQSSHTPEHTDAMIQGLMDSGRRTLYTYAGGRSDQPGYEFPGSSGNTTTGIGRLRNEWFSSDDQLVTLGMSTGNWALAREFGAQIVNHDFNGGNLVANAGNTGPDMVSIHAVNFTEQAWQVAADNGVHISIAGPIEMQMGHGTPPYQAALDHGILPSLSCDVDTNMTHDMFTQMRTAFTLQRLFVHTDTHDYGDRALLSCHQVLQMATVAGASAAGLSSKVGMLGVGMEADVIVLNARHIGTHPMVKAHGTVVTMMDTSHVDTVIIGGVIKKRAGRLVGVNVEKLLQDVEQSQQDVLDRIQGPYIVGPIPDFAHDGPGYTPSLLGSCCLDNFPYNATP